MDERDELIRKKCQDFLKEMKSIRKAKGLTTQQLADITGIKQSNISRIENGSYMPNLYTLMRVASGLGVDLKII